CTGIMSSSAREPLFPPLDRSSGGRKDDSGTTATVCPGPLAKVGTMPLSLSATVLYSTSRWPTTYRNSLSGAHRSIGSFPALRGCLMAAPPLFDLDELLEPIPGPEPAGSPSVFYEIKSKLDEMRREVFNPEELPEDDPDRQRRADWVGLEKLARDTLKNRAKDLRVVNYLVLALVRQHG